MQSETAQDATPFEPFEAVFGQERMTSPEWPVYGRKKLMGLLDEALATCRVVHGLDRVRKNPHAIVEVGSWAGSTALKMAKTLKTPEIYCVDHWQGSDDVTGIFVDTLGPKTIFQGFCRNMDDRLFRNIFPCVGKSTSWAEIWPFQVSAVFIDAGHDYDSVMQDLEAWWPHVLPGGLFIGHDYRLFPEVARAVQMWFGSLRSAEIEDEGLNDDEELWWVWKPPGPTWRRCKPEVAQAHSFKDGLRDGFRNE